MHHDLLANGRCARRGIIDDQIIIIRTDDVLPEGRPSQLPRALFEAQQLVVWRAQTRRTIIWGQGGRL